MNEYCLLDGPLAGQTIGSTTHALEGQIFDVEVVDVDDRPGGADRFAYRVVTVSREASPGTLRYVPRAA